MKTFITGGTGFLGGRVLRKLLERGDEVTAIYRSEKGAQFLRRLGAIPVKGDITEPESLREAMRGSDLVFHIAGWYKIGARDLSAAERINVDGTRNVLGLAFELGIPKIVYTSTVAVFGDTYGVMVDETYVSPGGNFLTEYDRTKWKAHYEVALPLMEQGAPIVILIPGVIYGPEDNSLIGDFMRRYYLGQLAVLPAPELTVTYAHVDDIAAGHLLAADKGRPGESYILAGPPLSLGEAVKIWAEVTGHPAPILQIPARFIKPLGPLIGLVQSMIPLPEFVSQETIAISDATYLGRSDKVRLELGWETRPLREGFKSTFDWIAKNIRLPLPASVRRRKSAGLMTGIALGLLSVYLLSRLVSHRR